MKKLFTLAALALIAGHAFSYPYEEIRLKPRRP